MRMGISLRIRMAIRVSIRMGIKVSIRIGTEASIRAGLGVILSSSQCVVHFNRETILDIFSASRIDIPNFSLLVMDVSTQNLPIRSTNVPATAVVSLTIETAPTSATHTSVPSINRVAHTHLAVTMPGMTGI
mmetsp:Transcript_56618/g.123237  ORF Transcript_56618/g.123237 Transcript_56618/m.123237 type:complete len:132 (+) Transcript_56618:154-549(+)